MQSNACILQSILQRVAYVSCRGYLVYPAKCVVFTVNQGGTADKEFYSSLTDMNSVGDFLFVFDRDNKRGNEL